MADIDQCDAGENQHQRCPYPETMLFAEKQDAEEHRSQGDNEGDLTEIDRPCTAQQNQIHMESKRGKKHMGDD